MLCIKKFSKQPIFPWNLHSRKSLIKKRYEFHELKILFKFAKFVKIRTYIYCIGIMWNRKLCPAVFFVGSLILFLCTLAPTVTFVDSGELIITAKNLGVAHPPGFPLYLLIAHLASLLPFGNVAQRVNFASAFCAAIAVALVYLVTIEAIRSWQLRAPKQISGKSRSQAKQAFLDERYEFVPGLIAGCLAAFSRTLWSYATVAEVYTLNSLLILLAFLFVLRWRNQAIIAEGSSERGAQPLDNKNDEKRKNKPSSVAPHIVQRGNNRLLYLAAFVFGAALGVHHVTVALTLPAIAWLVYSTKGFKFIKGKATLIAAAACLAGCAVYIYLPLAALHSPVLNWGNPDTLGRFWTHITGRQYQTNFSLSPDQIEREISSFTKLVFREFGWPWLPAGLVLAGIGFYSLYRKDRALLIFLILIIGFNLLFCLGYEIAEDKDAYSLPIFLSVIMAAGFGTYAVLAAAKTQKRTTVAIVLILIPVLAFAANVRVNNRHNYRVAEEYVRNVFSTIAPNGLLLTGDWQVASPMLYFQEIERQRRDVVLIDVLLLRRSWYYGYLESKYPDLMRRSHDSVQLFMEDLLRWEKDPDAYQTDSQLNQRIDSRFCSMIATFVKNHLSSGPAYATVDVVLNPGGENQTVAKSLLDVYQIVPQGLVFRLFDDRGAHQTELPHLEMRGVIDRSPATDEDQVIRQKILPVYVTMLINCGRAFSSQGDKARAMDAYRQAWRIDSALVVERKLLPPGVSF